MLLDRCIKNNSEEKIKLSSDIQHLSEEKQGKINLIISHLHHYHTSY